MDIIGLLAGGVGGGLFGLVGNIANRWMGLKEQKLKNENDMVRFKHEVDMRAQERIAAQEANEQAMDMNREVTESELAKTVVAGSYAGLKASLDADAQLKSYKWVDAVKGLMRPLLTLGFSGTAIAIYVTTNSSVAGLEFKGMAVATCLSLAAMTVTWWFGDRMEMKLQSKYLKK